jgi:hypothetical protein
MRGCQARVPPAGFGRPGATLDRREVQGASGGSRVSVGLVRELPTYSLL